MDCKKAQSLVNAYIDGELELAGSLELEAHLQACAQCRALRDELQRLSRQLAAGLARHAAPDGLRRRLALAIPGGMAAIDQPPSPAPAARTPARPWQRRQMLAWAASLLLAVFAASGTTYWATLPPAGEPIAEEAVASHIRSLMAGHLIDIASSDQHTVKPWFDGKVDLAPTVGDFAEQGFPLVGGRLDYIGRQPVAAIVYKRAKHFINLFACPAAGAASGEAAVKRMTIRGYNLLSWTTGDIAYWAVSDVNAADLETLRHLILQSGGGARG